MKVITALGNKIMNEELKKLKDIEILNSDIQYKEGILEYLEKNKNVDIILISQNLLGQINIKELIKNIQKINDQIKIVIFVQKKEEEKYDKNIQYIYREKIDIQNILKIMNIKNNHQIKKVNNVIKISGNSGSGKTTLSIIMTLLLSKKYKILLIEENKNNTIISSLLDTYQLNQLDNNEMKKIKNNFYLLNNLYFVNKKINILEYLNKIKKEFDYIIIDSDSSFEETENKEIINKIIFLLEPNLLEIKKAKNKINKKNIKIILNKINMNSIDDEIIKNIISQKIIGKINYTKNINLFINHQFNLNCLNKKEKNNFLEIIKKI